MPTALQEHAVALLNDLQSRVDAIRQLIATTPRPPEPRPQESDATLRRRIARLRAGRAWPTDPPGDPDTVANGLQQELDYRVLTKLLAEEADVMNRVLSADLQGLSDGLMENLLELFHAARHMPEAQDPNSGVSEFIRIMERGRRATKGRARRR